MIHWFRRDLRIRDNPALFAATKTGLPVVAVYIVSNWSKQHPWTGANRQEFLCEALRSLDADLAASGISLMIRHGEASAVLPELARETGAAAIHCNASPDPFGKQTEARLARRCAEIGTPFQVFHDVSLHRPTEIFTTAGTPFRIFTPYFKAWSELPKPSPLPPPSFTENSHAVKSAPLPTLRHWHLEPSGAQIPSAGETAAQKRMRHAIENIAPAYGSTRDTPAVAGTSRLSQDLRHGTLSIRTLFSELSAASENAPPKVRENIAIFIKELAWREFYFAILHHFPHVLDEEFNPDWRGLPWAEPGAEWEAWQSGRTGFPIVDAGMRELLATGHMHNRLRMITAMFLTKDLHLDWKIGESHFMRHLVDGEIASNNGGWQWSAGTGADAAPYFRIQNPWLQSARHDPEGTYIRRWIPELAQVPAKLLHSPPAGNKPLTPGYPLPIVDHARERNRTLAMFKKHAAGRH